MNKSPKNHDNTNPPVATVLETRPADFPLGSLESRAAARAMLEAKGRLTQSDRDCLVIYSMTVWVDAGMSPNYRDIEGTEPYKRGREISDRLYGPIVPSHLDPEYNRRTMASLYFEEVTGRKPLPGDTLTYVEFEKRQRLRLVLLEIKTLRFCEAWARQIPCMPCPLKFEQGRLYYRSRESHGNEWVEYEREQPRKEWAWVEQEVLGLDSGSWGMYAPLNAPLRVSAVKFVESKDGKRRAVPVGKTA